MKRCSVVPYEGNKGYIFISYSHKDAERINPILERLEKEGYRLWYDEGIDPGSEWPETIANHLDNASVCIGFITANYLASVNCRRELNFALKRQIPYLSILLEEVQMSAGVEMQLSANQAIFKYMLPTEETFYQKINVTSILQDAREKPAPKDAPPATPAPTPVQTAVASAPVQTAVAPAPLQKAVAPAPLQKAQTPANTPAQRPESGRPTAVKTETKQPQAKQPNAKKPVNKKGLMIAAIALAAVIVTVVIILVATGKSSDTTKPANDQTSASNNLDTVETQTSGSNDDESDAAKPSGEGVTTPAINETVSSDTDIMSAPETPENMDTFLISSPYAGRVLWGKKTQQTYGSQENFSKNIKFVDIKLKDSVMNLSEYPYSIEIRKDEHPEIVRLVFCDQVNAEHIVQSAYSISGGVLTLSPCDPVYDDAQLLAEELTYEVSLWYGTLRLNSASKSYNVEYISDGELLSGAVEGAAYREIEALETNPIKQDEAVILRLTDGGKAEDAVTAMCYEGIQAVRFSWKKELRNYNGNMSEFDVNKDCTIYYFNTYPYGFLLIKNEDIYFYQKSFSAEEE